MLDRYGEVSSVGSPLLIMGTISVLGGRHAQCLANVEIVVFYLALHAVLQRQLRMDYYSVRPTMPSLGPFSCPPIMYDNPVSIRGNISKSCYFYLTFGDWPPLHKSKGRCETLAGQQDLNT